MPRGEIESGGRAGGGGDETWRGREGRGGVQAGDVRVEV